MYDLISKLFALLIDAVDHAETQAQLVAAKATWDAYATAKAAADAAATAKFGPRP